MGKFDRMTRSAPDRVEVVESYAPSISDAVILAREAVALLVQDDLRSVEMTHQTETVRIVVKARA